MPPGVLNSREPYEKSLEPRRILAARRETTGYGSTAFNRKLLEKVGKKRPRSALAAEESEGISGAGSLQVVPLGNRL